MAMTLVETVEVGSGGAFSVTIGSIPQDALDLLILVSSRSTEGGYQQLGQFKPNGAASSFSSGKTLIGSGSGSASVYNGPSTYISFYQPANSATSYTYCNTEFLIPNYTSSQDKNIIQTSVSENNSNTVDRQYLEIVNKSWQSSAAVTEVYVGVLLAQYSTISVYTIS
jgi:hypothetical protein